MNEQTIQLCSPQQTHFEAFIVANAARYLEKGYETRGEFLKLIGENTLRGIPRMVAENTNIGQTVTICGAGPSLADNAEEYAGETTHLWGCNSALTWLCDKGYPVTHGFAIDQGAEMLIEWKSMPDVEYLLATTTHPHLGNLLHQNGRRITYFHNFTGIKKPPVSWPDEQGVEQSASYEYWMYSLLYPSSFMAGSGLNSVTRAIDVAQHMGYDKIVVLGADCALRAKRPQPKARLGSGKHLRWLQRDVQMHADGSNALRSGATPITFTGVIDGRTWVTKPDMAITASSLIQMQKRLGDRLVLVGDTLPNAIKDKPDDFLSQMPALQDSSGEAIKL